LFASALFYRNDSNKFLGRLEGLIFYLVWPGWILGFMVSGGVDATGVWTGVVTGFIVNGAITSVLIYAAIVMFRKVSSLL
jgi:hypothetical protein